MSPLKHNTRMLLNEWLPICTSYHSPSPSLCSSFRLQDKVPTDISFVFQLSGLWEKNTPSFFACLIADPLPSCCGLGLTFSVEKIQPYFIEPYREQVWRQVVVSLLHSVICICHTMPSYFLYPSSVVHFVKCTWFKVKLNRKDIHVLQLCLKGAFTSHWLFFATSSLL